MEDEKIIELKKRLLVKFQSYRKAVQKNHPTIELSKRQVTNFLIADWQEKTVAAKKVTQEKKHQAARIANYQTTLIKGCDSSFTSFKTKVDTELETALSPGSQKHHQTEK